MRQTSSTSSFECPRRVRLWRSALPVVVMLGFCAVARVMFWAGADSLQSFPSTIDDADFEGARQYLRSSESPRVIVFGSSILRDGLPAPALAGALNMPASAVRNASYSGGSPVDVLMMLREEPHFLDGVELLITDPAVWQVNENCQGWRPPHFLRYASLRERMREHPLPEAALAVVDWVWPFQSERRRLKDFFLENTPRQPAPVLGKREAFTPEAMGRSQFRQFSLGALGTRGWVELTEAIRGRGIHFLILAPPATNAFRDWIAENRAPEYERFHEFVGSLDGAGTTLQLWERPEEVDLSDDAFFDYAHMNPRGAELFAKSVARVIRERQLIKTP